MARFDLELGRLHLDRGLQLTVAAARPQTQRFVRGLAAAPAGLEPVLPAGLEPTLEPF